MKQPTRWPVRHVVMMRGGWISTIIELDFTQKKSYPLNPLVPQISWISERGGIGGGLNTKGVHTCTKSTNMPTVNPGDGHDRVDSDDDEYDDDGGGGDDEDNGDDSSSS